MLERLKRLLDQVCQGLGLSHYDDDPYNDDDMAKLVIQEAYETGQTVLGERQPDGTVKITYRRRDV